MKKTKMIVENKMLDNMVDFLSNEIKTNLPVNILPDKSVSYKNYIIKELDNGNWGLFNIYNMDLMHQFFIRSCAVLAAKYYSVLDLNNVYEIKKLDSQYWSHFFNIISLKHKLETTSDVDEYQVLLSKYDNSILNSEYYKTKIFKMFKLSFVTINI